MDAGNAKDVLQKRKVNKERLQKEAPNFYNEFMEFGRGSSFVIVRDNLLHFLDEIRRSK